MRTTFGLVAMAALLLSPLRAQAADSTHDVVIYGGTSAGIAAAIQATRMGHSAIVIEPGQHLGGLTSGGLGWTDSGRKDAIGGVSREFYQLVKKHYDDPKSWPFGKREANDRYRANEDAMWTFEPKVAEAIYVKLLNGAGVTVVKGERLNRETGVASKNRTIIAITTESGNTYRGRMFIDATYEGDLLATAGVSFSVGREANSDYGETINGIQKRLNNHMHRFVVDVDPFVVPGESKSGLLPGLDRGRSGTDGSGDDRIQAYCFRMCMSNVPENRVPFPRPDGYDEKQHELLLRNFEAGDLRLPLKPDMMPNEKTDTNNNCAVSTDFIGMNYDYPTASYAEREAIIRRHEVYQKGLMWTLSNHPRVPESIRKSMSVWGLAKDEFVDNGNWPHQMYVREARRMKSDYVMTELDCRRVRKCEDSVGLGSYNMDSHNCQRYVTEKGFVQNEGDVQESPGGPYMISYQSIVPRKGEAENLLVPVCISASHIAYGSIRMEPVFMVLGQSAATAASIAMKNGQRVQDVEYAALRKRLLADGQVLDLPPEAAPKIVVMAASLEGIVIDDADAEKIGGWSPSTSVPSYVERAYLHDGNEGKGNMSVRFSTELKPGTYEIRLSYAPNPNRATNVPVTVTAGREKHRFVLNQKEKPKIDGLFTSVGRLHLAGKVTVEISNTKTNGYVIADAVQFVAVKPEGSLKSPSGRN
ncbi:MAG: FAD-dependent oxidoreductase [Planctomycetota bacterium]|nr:FAD-dependent oxidoreductase [Planctomycetota bacterium]MDA1248975.1 FAD-dependent oxidoreductase [Planctomycetota bacterium]